MNSNNKPESNIPNISKGGKLTLKIHEAKLTHDCDLFTKMDPYVVLKCNN